MNKKLIGLFALLCSGVVSAATYSTPVKPVVVVNDGLLGQRVCYYDGKSFSLGSILQVGKHYMICQEAFDYESNGNLRWYPLDEDKASSSKK
ncbi:TPA: DUF1496 domain-containing protein [Photobacterium damselae]|uniref:DUF1496 domain-containing protein n=1 Tax=Photobacterium damselae TaxID=38293 RepID=UPI00370CF1CD